MNEKSNSTSGGVGILTVLFIVFLVLKLSGLISWSWWWVTCPLWCPLVIAICVLLIASFIAILVLIKQHLRKKN